MKEYRSFPRARTFVLVIIATLIFAILAPVSQYGRMALSQANQQVKATPEKVGSNTSSDADAPSDFRLYLGLGLTLFSISGILYFTFRTRKPAAAPSGFQAASGNLPQFMPPAPQQAPPAVNSQERACPNPQCRRIMPSNKKFCTTCGTRIR